MAAPLSGPASTAEVNEVFEEEGRKKQETLAGLLAGFWGPLRPKLWYSSGRSAGIQRVGADRFLGGAGSGVAVYGEHGASACFAFCHEYHRAGSSS